VHESIYSVVGMKVRAVVVDDEELARAHLCKMLSDADVDVLAEGESGLEALNLAESLRPDLLFLDIQMPDITGMQTAAAVENLDFKTKVVFVTGYSEFAVEAFDREAFDYLIKPVAPERLGRTVERAQKLLSTERLDAEFRDPARKPSGLTPLQRLPVRTDYSIKLLRLEEIEYAVARDKKVYVRSNGTEHRTYYTLTQLGQLLPVGDFMRIHSSAMVRLDAVDSVNFLGNHTYSVTLASGAILPVGRAYYPGLQARLGI
jgi:two-component system LytT family response regulator